MNRFINRFIAGVVTGVLFFSNQSMICMPLAEEIDVQMMEQSESDVLVENIFSDVSSADWYRDYVQAAYDEHLMTGMTPTSFGPYVILSRAQFAVILYRMEGEPAISFKDKFADVPAGQFYSEAVMWASENGIVNGYDEEHFGPADSITREQIATMLYRYAKAKGYDMSNASDMGKFVDKDSASSFANDAMTWITEKGVITGRDGILLAPQDNTPRAEIATIISRFWALDHSDDVLTLNNGYRFEFVENKDHTWGIQLTSSEGAVTYKNQEPAEVEVAGSDLTKSEIFETGYDNVDVTDGAWSADAMITTANGSEILLSDVYTKSNEGVHLERKIEVQKTGTDDAGYALRWSMETADSKTIDQYEYFIPSMFYKDADNLASYAMFRTMPQIGEEAMTKETRTGLPMVMMRDRVSGEMLSVAHLAEDIGDESAVEKQFSAYRCDDDCQYGAVGVSNIDGRSIVFRYPYAEVPYSYTTGDRGQHCYHPIKKGQSTACSLFLFGDDTQDYNEAMILSYMNSFEELSPEIADIDMKKMYETAQKDMLGYVQVRGNGIGLPFAAYVDDGSIFIDGSGTEAVNFQMGFIGMQIPLAYQMMRYGYEYDDWEAWDKGVSIMNFWAERCKTDSGVVKVWFDTYDFRPYPAFLRIMTDGMEGMLDAWELAKDLKDENAHVEQWKSMIMNYADFLVREQNADGSFYRAYDYSGNAFSANNTDGLIGDANTQGTSKLNSAAPVRFLIRMHEAFGNESYKKAAISAGEFVLKELYPDGKYVGGTADNPNTIDKEAGMYAVYGYSALYQATDDEKYLQAMEQAVIYAFSWVYTYKFEAANPKNLAAGIPTSQGKNDGLSVIATGHSGVDNMIAYMYYEFFKLYVWTENPIYLEMADFVQNNSRQTMDLNGEYGYARRSFMIEATGVADMVFGTAGDRGIWLPWITCANIEPAADMEDTFGTMDVRDASTKKIERLREQLKNYGA